MALAVGVGYRPGRRRCWLRSALVISIKAAILSVTQLERLLRAIAASVFNLAGLRYTTPSPSARRIDPALPAWNAVGQV